MFTSRRQVEQRVRSKYSSEQYHALKVKAGVAGGRASNPNRAVCSRNGEAASLSNIKEEQIRMFVFCRESIGLYQAGKVYEVVVEHPNKKPIVVSPYRQPFTSWVGFVQRFKRMKKIS